MRHALLTAALVGVACVTGAQTRPGADLEDMNPSPGTVEVILTAMETTHSFGVGNRVPVWAYNGTIPGPTIEANVGDTLIVHFRNELPEETTVHWHGLEIPADMDGSHIAQRPVPPGGTFRYEFVLPRAAMFWYHPHVRTNAQVEKGLYGVLLVRDPAEDARLNLPTRDHVLVLDDVLIDDAGQIADPWPADPVERALTHVNGREGNLLLVNGSARFRGSMGNGVPQRLRLLNAANARFMRVSIPGHFLWRIGGDGGLLERAISIAPLPSDAAPGHSHKRAQAGAHGAQLEGSMGLVLTPGERADIVVLPASPDTLFLEWHDMPRGRHAVTRMEDGTLMLGHDHMEGTQPPQRLGFFRLVGEPAFDPWTPPARLRDIEPVDAAGAPVVPVMFGHGMPAPDGSVVFFAQMKDGQPLPFPMITPEDAPTIPVGETRIWEVNNMTGGDHNFHMHGFHFQLLETEYVDMETPDNNRVVPPQYLEDKDTIYLPRRPGNRGTSRTIVRLAARHDDEGREGRALAGGRDPSPGRSGGWLFHCHLLEHSASGMMGFFQITGPRTAVTDAGAVLPAEYRLEPSFPNPFNPRTEIAFHLPAAGPVRLTVYSLLGQRVRSLVARPLEAGVHRVAWDGRDDDGRHMASGVYLYHLRAGDWSDVRKMTLVR